MLNRRNILLGGVLSCLSTLDSQAQTSEPPTQKEDSPNKGIPPKITLEEALRIAKEQIKKDQRDTKGKYLTSATLDPIKGGYLWRFTWLPENGNNSDGWFMVNVSPVDGSSSSVMDNK